LATWERCRPAGRLWEAGRQDQEMGQNQDVENFSHAFCLRDSKQLSEVSQCRFMRL
jgi:hypothetical protein